MRSLYSPLGPSQIRLLTLLPGDSQDRKIQCTLKHATIQIESARDIQYWRVQETLSRSKTQRILRRWKSIGQPGYEALSYCWGPDEIYDSIEINGHLVPVRRGLWTALHHLRYPSDGKKRVLWTDALCINQDDLSERSDQVAIMYAIFNRASEVVVWLGEVYNKSNVAMKAIARSAEGYSEAEAEDGPRPEVEVLSERYQAILSLYNRPYWSRLWILQEICLAKKLRVHCGTNSVTWEQFNHFWMHFRRHVGVDRGVSENYSGLGTSYAIPEGLERLMDMMHRRTCFSGMLHLLKVSQHLQCWDVKDRVFGLLGLVHQPLESRPLQADYSTSLQQLYIDVMEWYIENEKDNLRAEVYGNDVLEMSHVLQDALEHPFQRGLGTIPKLNWRSGVSNVKYQLWMKPHQIIDHVQFVGPLMQMQQSQDGRFVELHVMDAKLYGLIFQQQSIAMQHLPSPGSTCCAFITMKGDVYLGGSDVEIGDGIYFIEKYANQNLWTFKIRKHEGMQWNDAEGINVEVTYAEVTGPVYPWAPFEDTPDSTAFVQQLKMSAQAIVPNFSK